MQSDKSLYLSIIIPAYNEEKNISSTLQDIAQYLKTKNYPSEVIVIDDGSRDKTAELASGCGHFFNAFTLLKNETNRGKGYTVRKGILFAKGELILFMDADNATRINQLGPLEDATKEGCDVAIASRKVSGAKVETAQPIPRVILGNVYILLSKLILGLKVKDYNCGFKLFKKEAAKKIFSCAKRDDWSFDSEIIYLASKLKLKIKEVPVCWQDKKETSKVRPLRDGVKSFMSLLKIRFTKYSAAV
jgi:glycosyltransferase involved in cell wall biosynthesis